ncbi:hypothetical protein GKQ38_03580 [Candidatus Nanohaloarchaea archaeon]|nr:hypothetical protein GKQ38_03580 [Candidatus Nanohaloarchaea archaeon]
MPADRQIFENIRNWIYSNKAFTSIITVFALAQLFILSRIWTHPLIWDTAIYWGMGKALFSGGNIGLWEQFRPPMLPVVLGALWKLGMPAEGFTRLLAVTISVTGLTGVYVMVKDLFDRKTAAYTAGITAATFTFVYYTNMLLTGIPASFLVFTSIYLATKKKIYLAGLLGGLAFLTRFPAAIVGPAAVFYLVYCNREELMEAFKASAVYTAGFFTLATPYLLANKYVYGSFLQPFIRGFSIPASTESSYMYGLYYMFNGVKVNPFLILLPVGLYFIVKYRKSSYYGFTSAFSLLYLFFASFPRKETRFMLLFLPLMALISAEGLKQLMDGELMDRVSFDRKNLAVTGLLVLAVLISAGITYGQNRYVNEARVDFYQAHSNLTGTVAANDAGIMPYGDFKYYPLPPLTLNSSYQAAQRTADYISVNSCAWYCFPGDKDCKASIQAFEQSVERNYMNVYQDKGESCNYSIYRVN